MKKVKKPFLVALGFAAFVAFGLYSYFHYRSVLLDDYDEFNHNRERQIQIYGQISSRLLEERRSDEARALLEAAREAHHIDYFIFQYKGEPVWWGTVGDDPTAVNLPYAEYDVVLSEPKLSHYSAALSDGTVLTVGIQKDAEAFVAEIFKKRWDIVLDNLISLTVILLAIAAYYFRDIKQALTTFRTRGHRSYSGIRAKSREAEILLQGLSGYEHEVEDLGRKATTLTNQVLPALRSEILSGKKPPYDFNCTLVRTDINNFSSIFHNHDTDKFMAVINDFFTEVSHIVSRYHGYVHEFVGDEVIFYFKEEECPNSVVTALSAIRDLNALAEKVHQKTTRELGYPFTVKSSLSYGKIRFGHLVNGFTLAGSVLIESVRILSHVVEKDGNVVCFDGSNIGRVEPYCDVSEYAHVTLKGFSGERTLYRYVTHRPLEKLLENPTPKNIVALSFYRSDEDLIKVLRALRSEGDRFGEDNQLRVIQVLRNVTITKCDGAVGEELMAWLEALAVSLGGDRKLGDARVLSAACMLMINLVPKEMFTKELSARLSKFLKFGGRRVVANVLDVLTHFKSEGDAQFVRQLMGHEDGRVAANALVFEGAQGISADLLKRLKKMLSADKPQLVASGLYALGEIANHHRTGDFVYYSSQVEFLRLVHDIPGFLKSPDSMVRRQALIAARKAGEAKVLDKIRALVVQSDSEELRELADEHLGLDLSNVISLRKAG